MEETDAVTAEGAPPSKGGAANELIEIGKTVAYALAIALVIRVLLFQPFTIPSASMEPNLYQGDYIIVSKFSYGYSRHSLPLSQFLPKMGGRLFDQTPKRGDIIVFKLPRDDHTDYIKRVIGLPGDRIQLKGGVVYVNGKMVSRELAKTVNEPGPYGVTATVERFKETLPTGKTYLTNDYGPGNSMDDTDVYVVPAKNYFVMGDNRDNSADSRYPSWEGVGFVPEENLVGKANIILLSWNAKASLFKPWTWVLDARPSRFFHWLQ